VAGTSGCPAPLVVAAAAHADLTKRGQFQQSQNCGAYRNPFGAPLRTTKVSAMNANPTLVNAFRGGIVESSHRGALAIVDADGGVHTQRGDIDRPIFPRSAIKVLQALPLVASGVAERWQLTDEELALACASHGGEPMHAQTAAAMLAKAGVDVTALECGDRHAFLNGYIQPDHPVMREVTAALQASTGYDLTHAPVGTDGCSIPTYAVPLRHLAHAFARVATGVGLSPGHARAAARLRAAVAGTDRFDSRVMARLRACVFCKVGAEGVYCAALLELGLGVAIKMDDGNNARACEVVMAAVLERLLPLDDADATFLHGLSDPTQHNWNGMTVGQLRAAPVLRGS
jgi:L-asparaginase II